MKKIKTNIRWDILHILLIISVALVSIGNIISIYFSYEDFHLFYLFQDSQLAHKLLVIPEYARHLNQYYFERFLWNLFGYNPVGYQIFTIFLSFCVYVLFYIFLRYVTSDSKLSLVSTIYLASAYYGVDSFIWSYNTGFDLMGGLLGGIVLFLCLVRYMQTRKIRYFIFALLIFPPLLYFYRARAFHFIMIIALLFFLYSNWKLFYKVLLLIPFAIIAGGVLIRNIIQAPHNFHVMLDQISIGIAFVASLGNFFFPSDITEWIYAALHIKSYMTLDSFEAIIGIGILTLIFLLYTSLKKQKSRFLSFFYLTFFSVISFIIFTAVASIVESGISIRETDSWGHTMTPVTLWTSALTGLGIITLFGSFPRMKKVILLFYILLVVVNISLARNKIAEGARLKGKLRYFYTSLLHYVPKVNSPSVFYFHLSVPRPYGPYTSGNPLIQAEAYIASYYRTNYKNILLADSFYDAMKKLHASHIPLDRFYYFSYADGSLKFLTPAFLHEIKNPKEYAFDIKSNQTLPNFTISDITPMIITYTPPVTPNVDGIIIHPEKKDLIPYYQLLIHSLSNEKKYTVEAYPNNSNDEYTKPENVINNDYTTAWLPKEWGESDIHVIVDIGEIRTISEIVWASNRKYPLFIRQPSEYTVSVSSDKTHWKIVKKETNPKVLQPDEYYDSTFTKIPIRYIKIAIQSTRGNYPPYIDKVEVFDDEVPHFHYKTYYSVKSDPLHSLPSEEIFHQIYHALYENNMYYEISQKVDGETNWPEDNVIQIPIAPAIDGNAQSAYINPLGMQVTGIKFSEGNFPEIVNVKKLSIKTASVSGIMGLND